MKRTELFYIVFSFTLIFSGCTKDDSEAVIDQPDQVFMNTEILSAVTHSIYGTDSIIYSDDQITGILRYRYSAGSPFVSMSYRINYEPERATIRFKEGGRDEEQFTFVFEGSELKQVRGANDELVTSFHYNSGRLSYILYHRNYFYLNYSLTHNEIATDSVTVKYDQAGININELFWYGRSQSGNLFELIYSCTYTHDNKNNPYQGSMYALARTWKGEDVISYFNRNNILNIGSHNLSYRYNDNGYPVYSDNNTYGRTSFYYHPK